MDLPICAPCQIARLANGAFDRNLTAMADVEALEEFPVSLTHSLVAQGFPDSVVVDTLERFLIAYEGRPQWNLPFCSFLLDLRQRV